MDLSALLDLINRIGTDSAPTDQELTEARAELVAAARSALEGDVPDLEAGTEIRSAIDDIDAELAARKEAREAASTQAAALLEGLQSEEEEPGDEEEGEEEEAPAEEEKESTTASTKPRGDLRAAMNRASVRAEADAVPEAHSDIAAVGMGPAAGAISNPNLSLDELASVFHRYNRHVGRNGRQALVRLEKTYPETRQFGTSVEENSRMVSAIASDRAIVASGGICGPLDADFSHPVCGDRGRPIRDVLPAFQADRGGLRFAPAVTVGDLTDAITVWTAANDADSTPAVIEKACPHIDCPDELEARVDAIVQCLTVGNFQAKFNPEFWRSRLDLLMVEHDRVAEQTLFAQMQADATNVTWAASSGGTAKEALRGLDRAAAGIRSRLRLDLSTRLNWIAPAWLLDALRSSLTNNADDIDEYAAATQTITSFFTGRNISPTWSNDLQVIDAQAAGALEDFPSTATTLLFPEGTYIFLDGGTLDLGIEITDSVLNSTNDRQAFAESFEQATFRGCEALEYVVPVSDDCSCVGAA